MMAAKSKLEKILDKNSDIIVNHLLQEMTLTLEKATLIVSRLDVPYSKEEDKIVDQFIAREILYCLEDYVVDLMRKIKPFNAESTYWLEVKDRICSKRNELSKVISDIGQLTRAIPPYHE